MAGVSVLPVMFDFVTFMQMKLMKKYRGQVQYQHEIEYEEHVKWTFYSTSPKIWKEDAKDYSELFVENG